MAINSLSTGFRPGVCTSSTRPTAPYEGQVIYETDTDKTLVWNGSAWLYLSTPQTTEIGGVAETWTPVVTQSVNVTYTNIFARYQRINKIVFVYARLNITSTGTAANPVTVSLPVTAKNTIGIAGNMSIYDNSASTPYNGFAFAATTTTVTSAGDWAGTGVWGTTPNLAIASGDVIWLHAIYEAE